MGKRQLWIVPTGEGRSDSYRISDIQEPGWAMGFWTEGDGADELAAHIAGRRFM